MNTYRVREFVPILLPYLQQDTAACPTLICGTQGVPQAKGCIRHGLNVFFPAADQNCQKEYFTGTLDFQMSSQQEEGCGHEQKELPRITGLFPHMN